MCCSLLLHHHLLKSCKPNDISKIALPKKNLGLYERAPPLHFAFLGTMILLNIFVDNKDDNNKTARLGHCGLGRFEL